MPELASYITEPQLARLIAAARDEDMGPQSRDITSQALIPADAKGKAVMRSRAPGRLCGAALLKQIAGAYDAAIDIEIQMTDGDELSAGSIVATYTGPLRAMLAMERIALNFTTHLSGIASLTAQYVAQTQGTNAQIYDTRKTLPGLRALEKYAVACGGGVNHRIGLYDAVLIKDNHLAHVPKNDLSQAVQIAITHARKTTPPPTFIEVEVDRIDQLEAVLCTGVDLVLLDNMNNQQLTQAVEMRNRLAPKVELEASGGVNLQTVSGIARTGVDRIAVGALTHSAPSLDLGLDIDT